MAYDMLIRGGEVLDPSQGIHGIRDIGISNGTITAVDTSLKSDAATVIDATGQLVVPGLIDMHTHVYTHTPIGLDANTLIAAGGVTTVLDAGSAGSLNFEAFKKSEIASSKLQIFGLVNLSCIGLVALDLGELTDRRYADPDGVIETINRNREVALGVKIRADNFIIGEGSNAQSSYQDAIRAARESGTWLMVHIGDCPFSMPTLLESLEAKDCITHCFKGGKTRIIDNEGNVLDEVWKARENGVSFDVGHGFASFSFKVAEKCIAQGFYPTTISTDLHSENINGPVFDLLTTMSKFLALGLSMEQVIEMTTSAPAKIMGQSQIGTLKEDSVADIAILQKERGPISFYDCHNLKRVGDEKLKAVTTIKNGHLFPPPK